MAFTQYGFVENSGVCGGIGMMMQNVENVGSTRSGLKAVVNRDHTEYGWMKPVCFICKLWHHLRPLSFANMDFLSVYSFDFFETLGMVD
ncbi:hypothetical protein Pyn_29739 [Prunus yedoensis var. nudiflora]|uniref:Uncharacterized protein n=1 Tax=Prunus yedoensis var. nudiflora TaxID=2094558 RepID=A0A314YJ75_PRUYE|nr:hypothetical protein Pyn_29739 [Prunus yedoensis var. nudiflora]